MENRANRRGPRCLLRARLFRRIYPHLGNPSPIWHPRSPGWAHSCQLESLAPPGRSQVPVSRCAPLPLALSVNPRCTVFCRHLATSPVPVEVGCALSLTPSRDSQWSHPRDCCRAEGSQTSMIPRESARCSVWGRQDLPKMEARRKLPILQSAGRRSPRCSPPESWVMEMGWQLRQLWRHSL